MNKITLILIIFFAQSIVFGQDRKNEVSITIGLSIPSGEHSDKYATTGFCNNILYKRNLASGKWKLTIGAFTSTLKFDSDAFKDKYNETAVIQVSDVDASKWKVSSLNIGAEWKFYKEFYLLAGINLYSAKYPNLTLYQTNGSSIKVTASENSNATRSSGFGVNIGFGYNIKLDHAGRWEIPVNFSTHIGSVDYGDFTFTDDSAGIKFDQASSSIGYISYNINAGLTFKF